MEAVTGARLMTKIDCALITPGSSLGGGVGPSERGRERASTPRKRFKKKLNSLPFDLWGEATFLFL